MKFLLDDNIPLSVKEWFKKKGIDAVKAIEVGLIGLRFWLSISEIPEGNYNCFKTA